MICSAFAYLTIYVTSIALLWSENEWQTYVAKMVTGWVIGMFSAIFTLLLLALILLHVFLMYNNLTTFEYILSKKTD
jgi:hypothetical protein